MVDVKRLAVHLSQHYGLPAPHVSALGEPQGSTYRVELADGRCWVARVFPTARPFQDCVEEAQLLQRLEQRGFPAERCASPEPVSSYNGHPVFVTTFVEGERAKPSGRTYAVLGTLMGRLNAQPGTELRPGGAWHHLSVTGGPTHEIDAALALLDAAAAGASATTRESLERLMDAVEAIDDCADLPRCAVHPDAVPVNTIRTEDEKHVLVDWTGAGCGPRIWSLALPLWAAGARDMRLVDAFISRYVRYCTLEPDELRRVAAAVSARPLLLDCWLVGHGRISAARAVTNLDAARDLGAAVGARVAELCAH